MARQILQVRVLTPRQVIFNGLALSVSSTNSSGRFDILPAHANFITIIQKQPIEIRKADNKLMVLGFNEAIIYTFNNTVSIYAEPRQSEGEKAA